MLTNKNQAVVSTLLGLGIAGFATATALPFNDRIEFRIGNRIESQPAWLVPPKAEFRAIERGYGGIKILLALLGTGGMVTVMLIARSEGEQEPIRQRIKQYKNQAYEFGFAAESAYQMATTQTRYKKLAEADEVAFEGQIETAYLESLGVDPQQQQPALTGTTTLDSVANPGDKVESSTAAAHASAETPTPGLLHPSETRALAILNQLAGSRMSLLLIAGTGGGKTVTQAALISLLLEKCPKAEFWVISQKNDNYCGLKGKGRVTIFDINQVKETLDIIHHVWGIYNTRRMLTEDKRKNLSPVRLLLADWLSINSALEKLASHPDVKASNYLVELADIVFNGRDFNVCLWADLQSFFLKAIGMEADSNSRQNFNLLGLGNYYTDEFGCVNDSYGVLSNMIGNRFMIDNKEVRTQLMNEFNRLKPISKQNERPILLSTLEPASICLQADVRHYQEHHQIASDKDASSGQANLSDNSSGTARSVSPQDSASAGNPYGIGADASEASDGKNGSDGLNDLNRLLTDVLAEASPPIFSADFPLQEHEQRVQLAKLVIAKNLGKEKTIFLLWGVTSGGRNHQRYADAREMLEKLIRGGENAN